ncbi:MAG: bifunctional serine/threonine-protein kinase/formylglycine-generating enzyme family protein [Planctomycetota bacterium]
MQAEPTDPESQAESLFAEYLVQLERGEAADFDRICRERPELEPHLRPLHRMLGQFRRILSSATRDVDPGISLAPEEIPEAPDSSPLLARLARQAEGASHCRILGEIARGGMGVILKGWDKELRRHLAIKVVKPRGDVKGRRPLEEHALCRLLEEAQVTGQLEHPGIVPVHELGLSEKGQVYFSMRLVEGDDLSAVFERIGRGEAGWTRVRALGLLSKACDAVAFAHSRGVIHRDLKPENIMVGSFGETYVMDWGLARVLGREGGEDAGKGQGETPGTRAVSTDGRATSSSGKSTPLLTEAGTVVGTPAYMPPEQAAGRLDDLGKTADVYSMGAILYHLLAGQAPYLDRSSHLAPHEIVREVLAGPPTPLAQLAADLPPELEAICDRAMARDRASRYPTMETLAEDLRAYMEQRVVQAYATGPFAELKKWFLRNRGLAATILLAALSLVAVFSWAFVNVRAERNTALAEQRRVLQLADVRRYADLMAEIDGLWPALPEKQAARRNWLKRADELLARKELHEQTLAGLRARGKRLKTGPENEPAYDFGNDTEARWWHETLRSLIGDLDALGADDPHGKTARSVRDRLEFAATIRERSIGFYRDEWDEAMASIADPELSPKYEGLTLTEQLGLVPLGQDPDSLLWEFWHVASGERPERDEEGRLVMTGLTGIVLVLLPGNRFFMGSQSQDPAGVNYDPHAVENEFGEDGRPVAVTLAPFFLSKYEMTQGQWERFTGENPSVWHKEHARLSGPSHPIEQVSWVDSLRILDWLGLELPTEAKWEYGCRAETTTAWHTGQEPESLAEYANLADQTLQAEFNFTYEMVLESFDDGFAAPAPVGALKPNAFGLYGMHGNVMEWCLDGYGPYDGSARAGDGARHLEGTENHIMRGGSAFDRALNARSAGRRFAEQTLANDSLGLRPARAVDS